MALDVKTGAVRVMAGTPSFDPTDPGKKGTTTFNNATQGLYPPGLDVQDRHRDARRSTPAATSPIRASAARTGR